MPRKPEPHVARAAQMLWHWHLDPDKSFLQGARCILRAAGRGGKEIGYRSHDPATGCICNAPEVCLKRRCRRILVLDAGPARKIDRHSTARLKRKAAGK